MNDKFFDVIKRFHRLYTVYVLLAAARDSSAWNFTKIIVQLTELQNFIKTLCVCFWL